MMSDQFCVWPDLMEDQYINIIIVSVYVLGITCVY